MITPLSCSWLLRLCLLFGLLGSAYGQVQLQTSPLSTSAISHIVTTPHLRAELVAYAPSGVQAGKEIWLGLQLQHQAGWHTYWKNPGDSGLPTDLKWTLPAGATAGAIAWPVPQKIVVSNLVNYGYEGSILLAVPVTVAANFQSNGPQFPIALKAQWLVCKTECIPEEGEFKLSIPVSGSTATSHSIFMEAQARTPKPYSGIATFTPSDNTLRLVVQGLPANWQSRQLDAIAEEGSIIDAAAKTEQTWTNGQWAATLLLSAQRTTSPASIAWVVKISGLPTNPALRVTTQLEGTWPAAAKPVAVSPALEAALEKNKTDESTSPSFSATWFSATFWLAVLGAFIGGLVLNLMPCVLPVLTIKLLSFAPKKVFQSSASVAKVLIEPTGVATIQSDDTLSFRLSSGLFAVGVVVSFVVMGSILLLLRGAGQHYGWGFQMQSPAMIIGLAILFLIIGLNLFEIFELRLVLPQQLVNFQSKHPGIEAFLSGALAVLIATPCTAPFMGASIGLAISLPAAQGILIFAALGLGMVLPFILVALSPRVGMWLLSVLPKPGAWMNIMRHFLAWPVFATVLWLTWIYAQQTSMSQAFALLFVFLMLTALAWALRLPKGRAQQVIVGIFSVVFALSCTLWNYTAVSPQSKPSAAALATSASSDQWGVWTLEAQTAAQATGRPIFVDFTAAWCITCQINKTTTLKTAEVENLFKEKNVVLLRADWTSPNAAIAAELAKLGRFGLPVYAVYLPGTTTPKLLPEVLTKASIAQALSAL